MESGCALVATQLDADEQRGNGGTGLWARKLDRREAVLRGVGAGLECCRGQGQRAEGGDVAVFDSAGETEVVVQPAAAFIGARAV